MSIEAMKQALEALENAISDDKPYILKSKEAITALRQAIEQAEKQKPTLWFAIGEDGHVKYTTDSDRALKWKQAGSYRLVRDYYTSPVHASDISQERVDETVKDRHEPESNNVEIAAEQSDNYAAFLAGVRFARVNSPAPQKKQWVSLTDEEIKEIIGPWGETLVKGYTRKLFDQIEAKLKEKNNG